MPERATESPLGRSIWSGSISFGLVTVPVELYAAYRRRALSLRMLAPSGRPLARQYKCPEDGRVLDGDQIERGFEAADGEYVVVTEEELEAVAPGRSRDISLERFVPRAAIDPAYFVRSYLLLPGGEQVKAYALLAATMEESGRAAIARFVMRGKAYAVAIFADRGVLRAETLRFGDEVRTAADVPLPEPAPADRKTLRQMAARVAKLSEKQLAESELRDDQTERLVTLARRKRERGQDVVVVEPEAAAAEPDEGKVVDLMALLKERMRSQGPARGRQGARAGVAAEPSRARRAARRPAPRRSARPKRRAS